jgi:hypothetical protein
MPPASLTSCIAISTPWRIEAPYDAPPPDRPVIRPTLMSWACAVGAKARTLMTVSAVRRPASMVRRSFIVRRTTVPVVRDMHNRLVSPGMVIALGSRGDAIIGRAPRPLLRGISDPVHPLFISSAENARGPLRAAGDVSPCSNIET